MKAMVLAAGLGTRLRPITDKCPKALVTLGGRTLLEITLARLRTFGITEVVVNAHHFADMVIEYLRANSNFGMEIEVSREDVLLDTGGGLKRVAPFFLRDGSDEPFVLHNVDVISTIDLHRMAEFHKAQRALATLAVIERESSRQLLFDEEGKLCGRRVKGAEADEIARPSRNLQPLAFSGIHIISPRLLSQLSEDGVFSIVPSYMRLAAEGETISAFRADEYYWRDLGRLDDLKRAEQDLAAGKLG